LQIPAIHLNGSELSDTFNEAPPFRIMDGIKKAGKARKSKIKLASRELFPARKLGNEIK
jgi:hypothetical protein